MTLIKAYKKITNIVLSVFMIIGLFTVRASVDSSKYEVKAEGTATLMKGENLNAAIKTLAGDSSPNPGTTNTTITAFERSATPAPTGVATADISSSGDGSIVAWFDNGTIYWYSAADIVYMNSNSNVAFMNITSLSELDLSEFDISNGATLGWLIQGCSSLKKVVLDGFAPTSMSQGYYSRRCRQMNRVDMVNTVGVQYLTDNIENGEYSYPKAFKEAGIKFNKIKDPDTGKTYEKLDIRFEKDGVSVLVETKDDFTLPKNKKAKDQLSAYVEYEKELTGNKVIAILANTRNDNILVYRGAVSDANLMNKEVTLRSIDEYVDFYSSKVNDKENIGCKYSQAKIRVTSCSRFIYCNCN